MPNTGSYGRRGDASTKWLIGGSVAGLSVGLIFLAAMSDQIRFQANGNPGPLLIITMMGAALFGALAFGPIGRAIGKRILEGGSSTEAEALAEDVHDLRLQAEDLRQALMETQERLDFTERMLAGGRDKAPEELH
jgi:hypothetical protein